MPIKAVHTLVATDPQSPLIDNDDWNADHDIEINGVAIGASVVQVVYAETTTGASTATAMPMDSTIPQNTEGAEALTLAITPKSATSKLFIQCEAQLSQDAVRSVVIGLFVDSTANAIAARAGYIPGADFVLPLGLGYELTSGSTSSRTYKLRYGGNAGTTYLNRNSVDNPILGGVVRTFIRITEYE